MKSLDYLKTCNLSDKAGNQHPHKKQSHDESLKPELKPFNDERCDGAEHYIEENTYNQYDSCVLKSNQQVFVIQYLLEIVQGKPALWRKEKGDIFTMSALVLKEANNTSTMGASTMATMARQISCFRIWVVVRFAIITYLLSIQFHG